MHGQEGQELGQDGFDLVSLHPATDVCSGHGQHVREVLCVEFSEGWQDVRWAAVCDQGVEK